MSASPPPKYVDSKDVEQPPSYDSLFGKIKEAKEKSDGNVDFVNTCCAIICGSLACTICLGVFLAIPISMIVIGAIYLNDCPAEKMIPIYLIVAGSVGLVSNIISIIKSIITKKREQNQEENSEEKKSAVGLEQLFNTFLFAWFIAGNVWVYRTYNDWQRSDSTRSDYCDPTLYYFAFWMITSSYIIAGLLCFGCIIFCIVLCCCCAKKE